MPEPAVDAYLAAIGAELRLPEPWATEVLDEIAAHLTDGIDEGTRAGLTADDAAAAAIARLGPPDGLARDLRRAHQTPRRLAAGLAGGAVAAVGGAVRGTILGYVSMLAVAVLVFILVTLLQRLTGLRLGLAGVPPESWTDTIGAVAVAVGAFTAARAATLTVATRSRRDPWRLGRWLAVPGMVAAGAWAVFGASVALSWPVVLALLAVPGAFAAGALLGLGQRAPRLPTRSVAAALLAGVLLPAGALLVLGEQTSNELSALGGGPYATVDDLWHAEGLDLVGRPAPPAMTGVLGGSSLELGGGVATERFQVTNAGALHGWSDLRLEAWRMTPTDFHIAPGQTAPFAIAPASLIDGALSGSVRVDRTRGVETYGVLLTGVAPDGVRYVLAGPDGGQTAFRGTVWEWFTAP
jgi:hypothetical protein